MSQFGINFGIAKITLSFASSRYVPLSSHLSTANAGPRLSYGEPTLTGGNSAIKGIKSQQFAQNEPKAGEICTGLVRRLRIAPLKRDSKLAVGTAAAPAR